MKRSTIGWTGALVLMGLLCASAAAAEQPTKIVKFVPAAAGAAAKAGNCWTSSMAVQRPDAWRCMAGNEIFDPCFTLPGGQAVVCNPDPAMGDPGFTLKLTERLPKPDMPAQPAGKPAAGGWLVELEDGSLCRPITGAGGMVGDKALSYYCGDSSGKESTALLDEFNTQKPKWTAEKATITPGSRGPKLLKSVIVGIKTVWQ